ncbi:L,D-transpeptidase [Aureimonas populi]|uniref:L,D-transpeptidase n=1 Tax=Aureimonas populi TaxID=1701758 RepID=A0ABW5CJL8_9HYPH|nr:L,D-transpeptidase [Aureimonas populi]
MTHKDATRLSRRAFVAGLPLALGACVQTGNPGIAPEPPRRRIAPAYLAMYAAINDEPHPVPAIDLTKVDDRYFRQIVAFAGPEQPGSIVVDPQRRFLYLVQENGEALRYGCGVGRAGFDYQGEATVARKAAWPRWTPTPNMIRLDPERNLPYRNGMEGGPTNPLGARALYLYRNGRDTLYRIHGTHQPWSIGRSVSSGCVRMFNHDIIDLHRRVPTGTRVMVLPHGSADRTAGGSGPVA